MRFKTDTEAVILAVLANGPKHGYGIAKTIRTESDGVLKLGEGQLYPLLRAMEEAGWVLGEWDPAAGDQPRRIYSLSDAGRAELERRAQSWQTFVQTVGRFIPAPPPKSQAEGPRPFALFFPFANFARNPDLTQSIQRHTRSQKRPSQVSGCKSALRGLRDSESLGPAHCVKSRVSRVIDNNPLFRKVLSR